MPERKTSDLPRSYLSSRLTVFSVIAALPGPTGLSAEFHVECGNGPSVPQPGGDRRKLAQQATVHNVPVRAVQRTQQDGTGGRQSAMLGLHGVQAAISLLTPLPEPVTELVIGAV